MNTYERGAIVEFGPPSTRRVGVVVGAYEDWQRGETLCVLTPEARTKGQAFDTCPIDLMNVQPSTWEALRAHADDVRRIFDERIAGFAESLTTADGDRRAEATPEQQPISGTPVERLSQMMKGGPVIYVEREQPPLE